ncbi:hypothetical protein E2562_038084 [Oryza meyeriana var. granulata]|uniref:Uncharacterized protein n=1 Tax=Oryza meyeriana var. granulata TaxID=110450 RepID=A0A6G1EUC4_9ORYZ|nr:hypothetical protein E2562_038084 [Oryza meyeriana var. granulata]
MVITGQNRAKKRPLPKRRRAIGPYSLEQMHPHVCITTASRQLKELVELEPLLDSFVLIGQVDIKKLDVRGDSKQDQGTREDKTKNAMVSARELAIELLIVIAEFMPCRECVLLL